MSQLMNSCTEGLQVWEKTGNHFSIISVVYVKSTSQSTLSQPSKGEAKRRDACFVFVNKEG